MHSVCIIGGSDAGISAALRIKELEPEMPVKLFLKDAYPNYSICGIPFFLSGEIKDWQNLAHRSKEELLSHGIQIQENTPVTDVDPVTKTVNALGKTYSYDKLLLATGAVSVTPPIQGLQTLGVFQLRWIDDMFQIERYLQSGTVRRVCIVGGGYIGLEMADAFRTRGLEVLLIETSGRVLKTLDSELGARIEEELQRHSVEILHQTRIHSIQRDQGKLILKNAEGQVVGQADMVLVATGARPNTTLLQEQGIAIGGYGAYQVSDSMETNIADVYAAGDCTETWHRLLQRFIYLPLGSTAHKQGRVAGEHLAGGNGRFQGSLGTQVVKVFNRVAARTGLHDQDCGVFAMPHLTIKLETWDHKVYYPGAQPIYIHLTGNPRTGALLGVQMVGAVGSAVHKRIDVAATAVYQGLQVSDLVDIDLSYTPPLGTPWDPLQAAAQAWLQANRRKINKALTT